MGHRLMTRPLSIAALLSAALGIVAAAGCGHAGRAGGSAGTPSTISRLVGVPRGGELYVESRGVGRDVVLIHGGQLDRRMWDHEFDSLAHEYHVIRYDVRGFGRSPPGPGEHFQSYEDLDALLDSLAIARTSIIGLSLGGRIAIDFAIAHPDRVDRLVLLAPGVSGFRWSRADSASNDAMERAIAARDTVAITDLWLRTTYMSTAMKNPEIAPRIRELSLANAGAFLRASMGQELEPPAWRRLRELRAPTLAVVGTNDDPDIRTIVDSIAAQAPQARKVVLPGAGHMLNLERPREVMRAVLAFLAQREDQNPPPLPRTNRHDD
jgi:3-oxoadipate enol-lactonase